MTGEDMKIEWWPRIGRYRGRHRESAQRPRPDTEEPTGPDPAGDGSTPPDQAPEPLVRAAAAPSLAGPPPGGALRSASGRCS